MFYESMGLLLEQAGLVLDRSVRDHVTDERALTQLDAVAALVADIGAMWPGLFGGLEHEHRILAGALPADGAVPDQEDLDPLGSYRATVTAFNDEIDRLHTDAPPDREARLQALRAAMGEAAEVQRNVVEARNAVAFRSAMRRI
jgi:hypothetical protein